MVRGEGGGGGGIQFYQSGYKLGPGSAAARWGAAVIFNFYTKPEFTVCEKCERWIEMLPRPGKGLKLSGG